MLVRHWVLTPGPFPPGGSLATARGFIQAFNFFYNNYLNEGSSDIHKLQQLHEFKMRTTTTTTKTRQNKNDTEAWFSFLFSF